VGKDLAYRREEVLLPATQIARVIGPRTRYATPGFTPSLTLYTGY
jgi:hypothetical protein